MTKSERKQLDEITRCLEVNRACLFTHAGKHGDQHADEDKLMDDLDVLEEFLDDLRAFVGGKGIA